MMMMLCWRDRHFFFVPRPFFALAFKSDREQAASASRAERPVRCTNLALASNDLAWESSTF